MSACVSRTSSTWLESPARQMSEALDKFRSLPQQLPIALPTTDFASAPSGFLKHQRTLNPLNPRRRNIVAEKICEDPRGDDVSSPMKLRESPGDVISVIFVLYA
ncbi:hypothetical protein J6590_072782 [Homalodisca vitripennis]|nr:hypothetical protein J6590_072782 [Homalodisca vitripennis]